MKIKRLLFLLFLASVLLLLFWQNEHNKKTNWQFYVENQIGAKSVINFANDISFDKESLFFSDSGNTVYSLNKKTGRINWTREVQDHSPFKVTIDQDSVYVANFDGHIYRLDKKTGFIVWSFVIPNQYWPETEVVFDENDEFVFFACRGGFLRALDKKDGSIAWERQFTTIDNTINFVEGSIHFGAIRQDDDLLYIKHFPSDRFYVINKNDGSDNEVFIEQKEIAEMFAGLFVFQDPNWFVFDDHYVLIRTNTINQLVFELLDMERNIIWTYHSEYRINTKSIYQDENRLYYLNADNTILNSLLITEKDPNQTTFKKLNFKLVENFAVHFPFKNSNPQAEAAENKHNLSFRFKTLQHKLFFFLNNLKKIGEFDITQEEKIGYIEFSINHEQNIYNNVFTQVKINAIFSQENNEKVEVKGFYYDHNQWKVRVKLDPGLWNWQINIKTPYWTDKQTGNIEISDQNLLEELEIKDDWFVIESNQVIWPIGLQDCITDTHRDGNPLNQMGHAKSPIASQNPEEFRFLEFSDYLDLYVEEAKINFFRYGPDNCAPSIWKNLGTKNSFAMDINGNLQGDIILNELRKRDIKSMMSIFAFYPPYISQEAFAKKANRQVLEQYVDYVIARYAALVDIWEIGNEALPPLNWLNFISNYLHNNDPYQHPITSSWEQPLLDNSDLLSIHWFAPTPENNLKLTEQVDYLQTKDNWKKAIMISEWGFQKQNQFLGSADIMRKFTWLSLFRGMGMIYWNTGFGLFESPTNANIYLGPIERSYLLILNNYLPQKFLLPVEKEFLLIPDLETQVYLLKNNDFILAYMLKIDESINKQDYLNLDLKNRANLQWINPKTGLIIKEESLEKGKQAILIPNFDIDLAMKISYLEQSLFDVKE